MVFLTVSVFEELEPKSACKDGPKQLKLQGLNMQAYYFNVLTIKWNALQDRMRRIAC